VADQLWFMTRIWEEEVNKYNIQTAFFKQTEQNSFRTESNFFQKTEPQPNQSKKNLFRTSLVMESHIFRCVHS